MDFVLLAFLAASLLGIWLAGQMVDDDLRRTVLISVGVLTLIAVGLGLFGLNPSAVLFDLPLNFHPAALEPR